MSSVYFINETKPFDKYGKCTKFLGYLPLASLSWLAYATVMIAKIAIAYKYFANLAENSESELFSPRTLKFTIAVSAPILQLMFFSHYNPSMLKDDKKYENKEGNVKIFALFAAVTFDILDSVEFMEVLFVQESNTTSKFSFNLECSIFAFPLIGFILPVLPLLILSHTYQKFAINARLGLRFVHLLIFILLINIPFFVLRVYLWGKMHSDLSAFVMKNVILIVFGLREVYMAIVELINKQRGAKNQSNESESELKELNEPSKQTDDPERHANV
ncbi:uncharacterized protein LOC141901299 [Tubulanus polymorphus]|uniref:uncharacterized protein LOC141901299 n=1 Tax=Tubulanus polymorphus TaxID=672921 RepID=UPI003DA32A1E